METVASLSYQHFSRHGSESNIFRPLFHWILLTRRPKWLCSVLPQSARPALQLLSREQVEREFCKPPRNQELTHCAGMNPRIQVKVFYIRTDHQTAECRHRVRRLKQRLAVAPDRRIPLPIDENTTHFRVPLSALPVR